MYCPQCGAEYREGYSSCSDCHALLVCKRPRRIGASARVPEDDRRVIWRGIDEQECVSVCYQLQDVNIPYKVTENPGPLGLKMQVVKRYELAVSTEDYERAKSTLGAENDPAETLSESEWQKMAELQEPEDAEELAVSEQQETRAEDEFSGHDSLPDTPARRDAYFRFWYPEDATLQVWSQQNAEDSSGAIEMALKENLIHCRVDSDGGSRKVVFVMPQDEAQAREIIREIIEGTPME